MPKAGRLKSIDSGRSKLRYQLAIACLALALTLLFIAVKFSRRFLARPQTDNPPLVRRARRGAAVRCRRAARAP